MLLWVLIFSAFWLNTRNFDLLRENTLGTVSTRFWTPTVNLKTFLDILFSKRYIYKPQDSSLITTTWLLVKPKGFQTLFTLEARRHSDSITQKSSLALSEFSNYSMKNNLSKVLTLLSNLYSNFFHYHLHQILIRFVGVGLFYIYYSIFIMYIDACLTDDEPLWEPIEWSLVQTWILFLFTFAWIAENLIVSRYGSYTGRDKRVWFAWYKTFWLMELYYIINFGAAIILVIVPFYYELNYNLSFVVSWWHWYTRLFFFKFISVYSVILIYAILLQFSVRWLFWKKSLFHIIVINIFIGYLLYTHFIMSFFGYFTNPTWYQQSRPIDYIQLSHEPSRWGWGTAKKDHFTYHNVKTVFWFKNDGPYASAFLLSHLYIFLSLFFLYIYWITLFRRVYSMSEVPLTFTTYCVSSLKQFFYLFLMTYLFILFSYSSQYLRYPLEYSSTLNTPNWLVNFIFILLDYPTLLVS